MHYVELTDNQVRLLKNILNYAETIGFIDFDKYESEDSNYDQDLMVQLTNKDIDAVLDKLPVVPR